MSPCVGQAARWSLTNQVNLDEALVWADSLQRRSLEVATEADMNTYGYQLLGQRKVEEAIQVFRRNVKDNPRSWNAHDSLGEAYALKGYKRETIASCSPALPP